MSRGLGKWERLILAEVEASGFAWVGAVAESIEYSLAAKQVPAALIVPRYRRLLLQWRNQM